MGVRLVGRWPKAKHDHFATGETAMTLPKHDDEKDANLLIAMIELVANRLDLNRTKIIRDDIDYIWAKPRETKQGHRKRAHNAWWSPEAFVEWKQTATIGEHVVPMKVVAKRALELVEAGALDRQRLLNLLRIPMAVITATQDSDLRDRKLTSSMPRGWTWEEAEKDWDTQIWARYAETGMAVSTFRLMGDAPQGSPPPGF